MARIIASGAKEYKNKVATQKQKPSRAGTPARKVKAPRGRSRALTGQVPCVLAIGGLDPGGGAGILADARAIFHAGAFPCAAVSLLTVQSTRGVRSVTPVATKELIAECKEVLSGQSVRVLKIGALGSEENAKAIADLLATTHPKIPSIVDTVMLPTRGSARLLSKKAVGILRDRILERTTLVTVNAPEAEVLSGQRVTCLEEAKEAARTILSFGPQAVLLKGGHLDGRQAIDFLLTKKEEHELKAKRLELSDPIHGGGCVLASLIAGRLALGQDDIIGATRWAKKAHHAALSRAKSVGGDMRVLFLAS